MQLWGSWKPARRAWRSGREGHLLDRQHRRRARPDADPQVVVDAGRPVDGDPVEVVRAATDLVEGHPARAGRQRLVGVVDVAVAVEQVHRAVERGRPVDDRLDDRPEAGVVGELRARDGRVEHEGAFPGAAAWAPGPAPTTAEASTATAAGCTPGNG